MQRSRLATLAILAGILQAFLAGQAYGGPADDKAALELARSYFQHLDHQRLDAARALMADSVVFEDPTWGAPPITDPEEVIEAYSNTAGFSNLVFDERFAFVFNETAVFHYVVSLDFTPPDESPVDHPVPVVADLVRMATVKDGKIVRHVDLAAYQRLGDAVAQAEAAIDER